MSATCGWRAAPAPVVLKTSRLGTRFFAHRSLGGCASGDESPEHLHLKALAIAAARAAGWTAEAEVAGVDPRRRAVAGRRARDARQPADRGRGPVVAAGRRRHPGPAGALCGERRPRPVAVPPRGRRRPRRPGGAGARDARGRADRPRRARRRLPRRRLRPPPALRLPRRQCCRRDGRGRDRAVLGERLRRARPGR